MRGQQDGYIRLTYCAPDVAVKREGGRWRGGRRSAGGRAGARDGASGPAGERGAVLFILMSQPPPPVLGALAARYTASAGSFASGAAAAAAPPPPPTAHGHMPPAKRQRQGDGGAVVPVPSYNAAGKRDDLWSETDDQEVMASAAKHPSQGSGSRWEKISAEVSAQTGKLRAPKSCRSRHARVLANRKKAAQGLQPDPNAATGLWTPEQDRQLRQLVTQHGTFTDPCCCC